MCFMSWCLLIVVLKFEHQKYLSDFEDELRREFESEQEELKKRHDDALRQQEQQVRAEVAHFPLPIYTVILQDHGIGLIPPPP